MLKTQKREEKNEVRNMIGSETWEPSLLVTRGVSQEGLLDTAILLKSAKVSTRQELSSFDKQGN